MFTPKSFPALIASLFVAFAANAHTAESTEGSREPEPQSLLQPRAVDPRLPSANAPSFNDLAQSSVTSEGQPSPSDHRAAVTSIVAPTHEPASLAWLALSGVAAVTLVARRYRHQTSRWLLRGSTPTGTQPAPWHADECDAQGWRLSRIEELPAAALTPLYSSLDDADERASTANVIPIDRHRGASAPQSRFNRSRPIDLDIEDVESRPIKG